MFLSLSAPRSLIGASMRRDQVHDVPRHHGPIGPCCCSRDTNYGIAHQVGAFDGHWPMWMAQQLQLMSRSGAMLAAAT